MKIAVIGGGSTYTPELVNGFLERVSSLPLKQLWLMDIDSHRLEIVGGFAQRMVAAKGYPFQVILTTDQRSAVQSAAYVITQVRVGQMPARVADEYLGRRHGLVGQETTGVGGMAKALRTIPVLLQLAQDMQELAPGAMLVNFTNPSGLVTEALQRYAPGLPSVGVCNGPIGMHMRLVELLQRSSGQQVSLARTQMNSLGLNHLSWYRGFSLDGVDVWSQVIQSFIAEQGSEPDPEWDASQLTALNMIPNSYLQYYYQTAHKLEQQAKWPPSRGQEVIAIEQDLLKQYADPALQEPPPTLMQRGGAYYSTVATQLLNAHFNDLHEVHVVNLRHAGAVPGWPADWVLEMSALVDKDGLHPLPAEPLPQSCYELLAQVKSYELLTVEAAVHGDRQAASQALQIHPLGPPASRVQVVLDDLLETHKAFLPRFFK